MRGHGLNLVIKQGICLLCLGLFFCVNVLGAQLFRWEDENGQVHYGDRIPPQYSHKEYRQLNQQGVTVNVKEREKSAQEKRLEAQRLAEQKAQEKQRRQRLLFDRLLLETYTDEQGIREAHQFKVAPIKTHIKLSEEKIAQLNKRLKQLHKDAANIEISGRSVPAETIEKMTEVKHKIKQMREKIAQKNQSIQALEKETEQTIERFRYLKQMPHS